MGFVESPVTPSPPDEPATSSPAAPCAVQAAAAAAGPTAVPPLSRAPLSARSRAQAAVATPSTRPSRLAISTAAREWRDDDSVAPFRLNSPSIAIGASPRAAAPPPRGPSPPGAPQRRPVPRAPPARTGAAAPMRQDLAALLGVAQQPRPPGGWPGLLLPRDAQSALVTSAPPPGRITRHPIATRANVSLPIAYNADGIPTALPGGRGRGRSRGRSRGRGGRGMRGARGGAAVAPASDLPHRTQWARTRAPSGGGGRGAPASGAPAPSSHPDLGAAGGASQLSLSTLPIAVIVEGAEARVAGDDITAFAWF